MRTVSFSEWLRPWQGLGLSYVLAGKPLALSDNLQNSELERDSEPEQIFEFEQNLQEQSPDSGHKFISDSAQPPESLGKGVEISESELREPSSPIGSSQKIDSLSQEPDKTKKSLQPEFTQQVKPGQETQPVQPGQEAESVVFSQSVPPAQAAQAAQSSQPAQSFPEGKARSLSSDPLKKRMDPPELKFSEWPSSYTKIFKKLNPAPALWTYRDLGYDLSGSSEVQRSDFFKEMIGLLDFPRGTSIFWPYSLPVDGQLQDNFPVFYEGIKKLRPRIIIVIGQSGMTPFNDFLPLSTPFSQGVFMSRLLILLPEFSQFYNSEDLVQRAAGYLRGALSGMNIF